MKEDTTTERNAHILLTTSETVHSLDKQPIIAGMNRSDNSTFSTWGAQI
jgi:hypothetical protein